MGCLPLALLALGGGGGGEGFRRLRDLDRGTVSSRTLPEYIRRRRLFLRSGGSCGRIRSFRARVVVVRGDSMVSGRSGMEAVKRTMSSKSSSGNEFDMPDIYAKGNASGK